MPTHHLLFGFTLWGFEHLRENPPDSIAELAPAGYHVLETGIHFLGAPGAPERLAAAHLMHLLQVSVFQDSDLDATFRDAKRVAPLLVNAHAGTATMGEDETCDYVNRLYDAAEEAGVRLVIETHRGRITQDLYRTARLCDRIPRLRFNMDVSHLVLCAERDGPTQDMAACLDPILDRVEMVHGRVSNGQQIQVAVGDGSLPREQRYVGLWAEAFRRWRRRSPAGASIVFVPELGPPNYAILDGQGREFSDRWSQSLRIREMAQKAWAMAASATAPLWP